MRARGRLEVWIGQASFSLAVRRPGGGGDVCCRDLRSYLGDRRALRGDCGEPGVRHDDRQRHHRPSRLAAEAPFVSTSPLARCHLLQPVHLAAARRVRHPTPRRGDARGDDPDRLGQLPIHRTTVQAAEPCPNRSKRDQVGSLGAIDLYTGVLPFATVLLVVVGMRRHAAWVSHDLRAIALTTVAGGSALLLSSSAYLASVPVAFRPPIPSDGYTFYPAPLIFIVFAAWLEAGTIREAGTAWIAWTAAALPLLAAIVYIDHRRPSHHHRAGSMPTADRVRSRSGA